MNIRFKQIKLAVFSLPIIMVISGCGSNGIQMNAAKEKYVPSEGEKKTIKKISDIKGGLRKKVLMKQYLSKYSKNKEQCIKYENLLKNKSINVFLKEIFDREEKCKIEKIKLNIDEKKKDITKHKKKLEQLKGAEIKLDTEIASLNQEIENAKKEYQQVVDECTLLDEKLKKKEYKIPVEEEKSGNTSNAPNTSNTPNTSKAPNTSIIEDTDTIKNYIIKENKVKKNCMYFYVAF